MLPGVKSAALHLAMTRSCPDFIRAVCFLILRKKGLRILSLSIGRNIAKDVLLRFKAERETIVAQAEAARRPPTWQEQEELFRWYSMRVDNYLDAGHGDCHLGRPEVVDLVAGAIQFHANERFDLHAWVVMPNHVHAVLHPRPDWALSEILKSWKGFSAREANRVLKRTGTTFWQVESSIMWFVMTTICIAAAFTPR